LLELFAGHGQNRFYRELEEWLSSITRLGFSAEGEGGGDHGAMVQLIDHMAEQMEGLREMHATGEAGRQELEGQLGLLAASVERLTDRLAGTGQVQDALSRVADGQQHLVEVLSSRQDEGGDGIDAESRMRLRSIDVQLLRILEELSAGRQETMTELRTDLAALTRAVNQARRPAPRRMRLSEQARIDTDPEQEG
jgi:tRNA threonylcarbamoyladenosine modification (KEOPS) complex Cgi121 subunit